MEGPQALGGEGGDLPDALAGDADAGVLREEGAAAPGGDRAFRCWAGGGRGGRGTRKQKRKGLGGKRRTTEGEGKEEGKKRGGR